MKTWVKEASLVLVVLCGINYGLHKPAFEWVGCAAVLFTFLHSQVLMRFVEANEKGVRKVECHYWARRYMVIKEVLWITYFSLLGGYSAIVGAILFLLYPMWRAWYKDYSYEW